MQVLCDGYTYNIADDPNWYAWARFSKVTDSFSMAGEIRPRAKTKFSNAAVAPLPWLGDPMQLLIDMIDELGDNASVLDEAFLYEVARQWYGGLYDSQDVCTEVYKFRVLNGLGLDRWAICPEEN